MSKNAHLVHPKYRPDIDGLRAIAVVSVVGYHIAPSLIAAGFIGVDIFFVISGYLISSIILSSLNKNRFSILEFYIKRIRRIFPALAFVLLMSLAYGWFKLFPAEYMLLGKHAAAGVTFISNIVFWRESGYFDTESELKPFLHLWSLGIEEQFYIVWPLLLLMAFKLGKRFIFGTLLLILFASFFLNAAIVGDNPTATFFLPVTRFWELLVGALLAYIAVFKNGVTATLGKYWKKQDFHTFQVRYAEVMSWSGVSLIIAAFVLINKKTLYPGWWALLPTLGVFLIIAAGAHAWFNRNFLATRVLVEIGLISYPLYLWHWPLLAFSRIEFGEPSMLGRVVIVCTSVLLAWGTYRWIEKPLRTSKVSFVPTTLAITIGIIGCFGLIIYKGWIKNATNEARSNFVQHFENSAPLYRYANSHNMFANYRSDCNFLDEFKNETKKTIPTSCYSPTTSKSIFIWGDSHAQQLNYGLAKTLPPDISILQVATSSCKPSTEKASQGITKACNKSNQFVLEILSRLKPDLVLLAQRNGHEQVDWDVIATQLHQIGVKKVLLVGSAPNWQPALHKILAKKMPDLPQRLTDGLDAATIKADNLLKLKYQSNNNLSYVSLIDTLCNQDGCLTYIGEDPLEGITSFDYGHLTATASLYVAQNVLSRVVMQSIDYPQSSSELRNIQPDSSLLEPKKH